jgi:uncharacterized protein (TIGR00255 family)
MTGFGRAVGKVMDREVTVELRSVNNRYREVVVRTPKAYAALEESIKKVVAGRIARGRLDLWMQVDETENRQQSLSVDLGLAKAYRDILEKLKDDLDLSGEIALPQLVQFKDVIVFRDETLDPELFLEGVTPVLNEALDKLVLMRQTEGQAITADFRTRLNSMTNWVDEITARHSGLAEETKTKLEARIRALTEGLELDQGRMMQEVAYLVDRSDITEELVRLRSHFEQFGTLLESEGGVGRRLDFLLQEINREVNTIGSKTGDLATTNMVVDLKNELEKIREQVQNVE